MRILSRSSGATTVLAVPPAADPASRYTSGPGSTPGLQAASTGGAVAVAAAGVGALTTEDDAVDCEKAKAERARVTQGSKEASGHLGVSPLEGACDTRGAHTWGRGYLDARLR